MSYLNHLRCVFAGDFQADVSTVNNDVRHYDNATFEARFQQFQAGPSLNGWWNPIGSGAFRLINCTVQSVSYQDGSGTTDRATDPAVGLFLAGSNDHVGAKLVDLDPQWQMSSQIWGLTMRFTDGQRPQICTGDFAPSAFRDLLFGRLVTSAGSPSASAIFQSVLTNMHWDNDLLGSRFLRELKAATDNGLMSVRLITFAYNSDRTSSRFTIGTAIGVIGPYTADEPRSFVLGRRMVPLNGQYTSDDINFFDCRVDDTTLTVFADFGNALPLTDGTGTLKDIGDLQLAVLHDEGIRENQRVRRGGDFTPLGGLMPYRTSGWLRQTSGVWVGTFPPDVLPLVRTQPLALLKMSGANTGRVAIRESAQGWLLRADNFVQRANAGDTVAITLFAARYGQPAAAADVTITLMGPQPGLGGGPPEPEPPQAPIPDVNVPPTALRFSPQLTTDEAGKAVVTIATSNPGTPRGYLDGQIYMLQYQLNGQAPEQQQQLDLMLLLLYDAYAIPDQPTWVEHIQPIFQQYGNLYPIMSQRLINLGDYQAVRDHRALLELAFSLDEHDPNAMPVTRDLSRPKRATILTWLRQTRPDGSYALVYGDAGAMPAARAAVQPMSAPAPLPLTEEIDGKVAFQQSLDAAQRAKRMPQS